MKTVEMKKATAPLRDYAQKMGKEAVILTENGNPVAALVAIENADWETIALSTNPAFLEIIQRSRARQGNEGGTPTDEMRRRLGLKNPKASD